MLERLSDGFWMKKIAEPAEKIIFNAETAEAAEKKCQRITQYVVSGFSRTVKWSA